MWLCPPFGVCERTVLGAKIAGAMLINKSHAGSCLPRCLITTPLLLAFVCRSLDVNTFLL